MLLRKHWFAYVPMVGIGLFMAFPLLGLSYLWLRLAGESSDNILVYALIIGGGIYALFILGLLLFGFIDYYLDVDIITNQRIVDIEQNGLFNRKISELGLDQVEDVSADVQGFFATTLHFGDVHIQTAGHKANFIFKTVAHPYLLTKIIADLHDAAIGHPKVNKKDFNAAGKSLEPTDMLDASQRAELPVENEAKFKILREEIRKSLPQRELVSEEKQQKVLWGLEKNNHLITRVGEQGNAKVSSNITSNPE